MKKLTQAEYLPIDKLKPFEGHPFYVKDDEDMEQLTESIRQQGVLNPIMVRPLDTGEYEVISGHRRLHACKKAGIEMIPAFIYSMDRSKAIVAMVDSNLHREKLLPSEKTFAFHIIIGMIEPCWAGLGNISKVFQNLKLQHIHI